VKIGISCYPSYGGSGIVATEIGLGLARRGHEVHFITMGRPPRLEGAPDNVRYHPVEPREYPVFPQTPFGLALTSAMVAVSEAHGLDVLHAHYAVPHATSAWMAREVLGGRVKVVNTLHGTDITVVGVDPSYLPITRHSILHSDAVTTPSAWLREQAWSRFSLPPESRPITVVPNFVDTAVFRPRAAPPPGGPLTLVHVSNFRPLKRVDRVVEVFARVAAVRDVRLVLVGEGPELPGVLEALAGHGLLPRVERVGEVVNVQDYVRDADLFLLTSESESFGVAALEALASGVPVVATAVGGVPEVVRHGETGLLVPDGDLDGLTGAVLRLLDDPTLRAAMSARARADGVARFGAERVLDAYEQVYADVLSRR
jgi:L-malate glycosyltransferase